MDVRRKYRGNKEIPSVQNWKLLSVYCCIYTSKQKSADFVINSNLQTNKQLNTKSYCQVLSIGRDPLLFTFNIT